MYRLHRLTDRVLNKLVGTATAKADSCEYKACPGGLRKCCWRNGVYSCTPCMLA